MKRMGPKARFAVIVVPALLLLVGWYPIHQALRQPWYKGRSLTSYLDQVNQAGKWGQLTNLDGAFLAMGTNSFPELLRQVGEPGTSWRRRLYDLIVDTTGFRVSALRPDSLQSASVYAIFVLRTNCHAALPGLEQLFAEDHWHAQAAFLALGWRATNSLIRLCNHPDESIRGKAAWTLACCRQLAEKSERLFLAPGWRRLPSGRQEFLVAWTPPHVETEIEKQLRHPNPSVRRATVESLLYMRGTTPDAISMMKASLPDDDESATKAKTSTLEELRRILKAEVEGRAPISGSRPPDSTGFR